MFSSVRVPWPRRSLKVALELVAEVLKHGCCEFIAWVPTGTRWGLKEPGQGQTQVSPLRCASVERTG